MWKRLGIGQVCRVVLSTRLSVHVRFDVLCAGKPIQCGAEALAIEVTSVGVGKTVSEVVRALIFGESSHASENARLIIVILTDRFGRPECPLLRGHD